MVEVAPVGVDGGEVLVAHTLTSPIHNRRFRLARPGSGAPGGHTGGRRGTALRADRACRRCGGAVVRRWRGACADQPRTRALAKCIGPRRDCQRRSLAHPPAGRWGARRAGVGRWGLAGVIGLCGAAHRSSKGVAREGWRRSGPPRVQGSVIRPAARCERKDRVDMPRIGAGLGRSQQAAPGGSGADAGGHVVSCRSLR